MQVFSGWRRCILVLIVMLVRIKATPLVVSPGAGVFLTEMFHYDFWQLQLRPCATHNEITRAEIAANADAIGARTLTQSLIVGAGLK